MALYKRNLVLTDDEIINIILKYIDEFLFPLSQISVAIASRGEACGRKRKAQPVDLVGIGNLLEYLVAADNITREERDRIMLRIAKENGLAEYMLYGFAGYGQSKGEVSKHIAHNKSSSAGFVRP